MSYSIENVGTTYAVINHDITETVFSRVLNSKEKKLYKQSQQLPAGVTVKAQHPTVETFPTLHEAQQFIKRGCKPVKDKQWGVFKSEGQYRLAKQLIKQ